MNFSFLRSINYSFDEKYGFDHNCSLIDSHNLQVEQGSCHGNVVKKNGKPEVPKSILSNKSKQNKSGLYKNVLSKTTAGMRQVAWHLNHRRSGYGKQTYSNGHGLNHGNVISEHNKTIEHSGHGSSHGNVISEHNKTIEHSGHGSNHGNVISEHNKTIEQNGHGSSHGNVTVSYTHLTLPTICSV